MSSNVQAIGQNPFEAYQAIQALTPKVGGSEGIGRVEQPKKIGQTQGTGLQSELSFIASNGMRVNDTNYGVNEPFATTPQTQLGKSGTVGANYRFLA